MTPPCLVCGQIHRVRYRVEELYDESPTPEPERFGETTDDGYSVLEDRIGPMSGRLLAETPVFK